MHVFKAALLTFAFTAGSVSASAEVVCDLTDLPCWEGGKCNIKFKNHTGLASGSGNGIVDQETLAMSVQVTARKPDGSKTGNGFWIPAGSSKTMNLEKKKKLSWLRIKSRRDDVHAVRMQCDDIKAVLKGNGNCNVYFGFAKGISNHVEELAYSCNHKTVNRAAR